jgi:hypothetical protein
MRDLCQPALNRFRDVSERCLAHYGAFGDERNGRFYLPPMGHKIVLGEKHPVQFCVIAAVGEGWEHISVSCRDRTPTWEEMDYIKRLFFEPNETCMQLHVPASDHINNSPYVLHIWRPIKQRIPRPPAWMV